MRTGQKVDKQYIRAFAQKVSETLIAGARAHYDQGKLIAEVRDSDPPYWKMWPGKAHASFADWSWKVMGYRVRKAETLAHNYRRMAAMNLSECTMARALRVGWTKLNHVLSVAANEMVLIEWLDRIDKFEMTEAELIGEVRLVAARVPAPGTPPVALPGPSMDDTDIDDKLENPPEPKKGAEDVKKKGSGSPPQSPAIKRTSMRVVFEDESSLQVVMAALNTVRRRTGDAEMGSGKAMAMIATAYLASVPATVEGGLPMELEQIIGAIEANYRVKLRVDEAPIPLAQRHPMSPVQVPSPSAALQDPLAAVMKPLPPKAEDAF